MRKLGNILLAILLCLCVLFPVACVSEGGNSSEQPTKTYTVILAESSRYTADRHLQTVEEGGSATFTMLFENGYTFGSVNCDDYAVDVSAPDQTGKRTVVLTVHSLTRSKRLEVAAAEAKPYYSVSVNASEYFTCENAQMGVEAGGSAVFTLSFDGEYTAKSVDYKGEYQFSGVNEPEGADGRREIVLTVKNVQKDEVVTVESMEYIPPVEDDDVVVQPVEGYAVVRYALNGGSFLDGSAGRDFTVNYSLPTRPRPNAENGNDVLGREGYTLVSWNTKADGSGTRVGLGSRAPVQRSEAISLYAQWAKWTDASSFAYSLVDDAELERIFNGEIALTQARATGDERYAVITAYTGGDRTRLVLPEYIDGYPVGGVYTGAVRDLPSLKTVIVAPQTRYIYDRAFEGCDGLSELVLHDGMGGLTDTSFGEEGLLQTLYINTVQPLTHKGIEGGYFAHKMEMLIAAEDPSQSKMVVWGTCATMYAIQSDYIEEYFPGRRDVVNMGVVGEIGSLYQVDLIKQYLSAGDAFIHLLDIGIPYAFFADVAFDIKVYQSVEDNYDLLASLDMRDYGRVLSSFSSYVQVKHSLTERGGTFDIDHVLGYLSEDGDAQGDWPGGYDDPEDEAYNILTEQELRELNAFECLNAVYEDLADRGLRVFTDISPFNDNGVDTALTDDMQRVLEREFASITAARLIGNVSDAMFDKAYIYDANYHLSAAGAEIYTKRMFDNLYTNW